MRNLMPITRPMGAADLTQAAEDAGKLALALSDLARGVAAYEAATGAAIAVVDADSAAMVWFDMASGPDETVFGSLDKTAPRAVEDYVNMDHTQIYRDIMATGTGFMQDDELRDAVYPQPVPETGTVEDAADLTALVAPQTAQGEAQGPNSVHPATPATAKPESAASGPKIGLSAIGADNALPKWNGETIPAELLDAMYPLPVPETGTVEDAVKAGAAAVADLVSWPAPRVAVAVDPVVEAKRAPQPASTIKKDDNALPTWQGKTIPADLRDAVQHLANLGPIGPKWGFQQDHEMIERAIDGQTETLIADVMEFSQSHIRQRFNKLVDRSHGQGNRFTREQIRDALSWMLVQDEMPAF